MMRRYKAMEMMMIEAQTKFVDELPNTEAAHVSNLPDAAIKPNPNPPLLHARISLNLSPYFNNIPNALLNLSNSSPSRSSRTRTTISSVILTPDLL
jgi:hypothetical protein